MKLFLKRFLNSLWIIYNKIRSDNIKIYIEDIHLVDLTTEVGWIMKRVVRVEMFTLTVIFTRDIGKMICAMALENLCKNLLIFVKFGIILQSIFKSYTGRYTPYLYILNWRKCKNQVKSLNSKFFIYKGQCLFMMETFFIREILMNEVQIF